MNAQIVPVERAADGALTISSLAIADGAGVQHKNVLELITKYADDLGEFGTLAFETRAGYNGARVRVALLNEQQSTLLMTYQRNNPRVTAFKLALVKAFYEMAQQLRTPTPPQPQSLEARMQQIMGELDAVVQSQHRELTIARPKASAWDVVVSSAGTWSYNDAAKVISEDGRRAIGEKTLVKCLMAWRFLYRDAKGRPHVYQRFIEQGLFAVKARTYLDHATGEVKESSAPQVRITGKGLGVIRHRLNTAPYAVTEAAS